MEQDENADDIDAPLTKEFKAARRKVRSKLRFARKKVVYKQNKKNLKKYKIEEERAEEQRKTLADISKFADNKTNLIDSTAKETITEYFPEIMEEKKVGWEPFAGPQTYFLAADEYEVLFSGGRAPGKSDALMMDALRYAHHNLFRGLVIRKAMNDLRDLIRRAKDLYPLCYPGTKWKEQEKLFVFPSGATIEFGYCDHEDDVARYQGQEYTWIGIDELTQIEKEETYEKLIMSVRPKKDYPYKTYVRATTNPNGPGKTWVKRRWVDLAPENTTIKRVIQTKIGEITTTRKWIHGTVFDNPIIVKQNPQYIAMLESIDNTVLRKQWLEGDWDSADGLAFDEFDRKVHVIEPFKIPEGWYKFRACDWGFKTKAVNLWFAVDYDNNVFVYRELVTTGVLAKDFGQRIRDIEQEANETIRYGVLDASAWAQRGENAPPPAEDMIGLSWRPSDRTKHSRITGKLQVHNFLSKDPVTTLPKLFIFNTCTDLITCISSLPINKNDPEDVDTNADDHAYDALRYGLMSRPRMNNNYAFQGQQTEQPIIVNKDFGY